MNFSVVIHSPDFVPLITPVETKMEVVTLQYSAFGGPTYAEVKLSGVPLYDFYRLLLRYPISIYQDDELPIWWGYISRLRFDLGEITLERDIKSTINACKMLYTQDLKRKETDWVTNNESIDLYGRKEAVVTANDITDAEANTLVANYLATYSEVKDCVRFSLSQSQSLTLYCSGWIDTLDWLYYQNLTGKEAYEETGSGGREIGEDDRPIAAMSFMIESPISWIAKKIQLRLWKYPESNPPTDSVIVELCSDSSNIPGTVLATATYSASEIQTSSDWLEKNFDVDVTLSPSTQYWIKIRRSGSVDKTKYYMVDTNKDNGYPRGNFMLYSTKLSKWIDGNNKGHLNFRILGEDSIQSQIEYLVDNYGQFLTGTLFEEPISTTTNQYRKGDYRALEELKKFLNLASSANSRMTAVVDEYRRLIIKRDSQEVYGIDRAGNFYTPMGFPILHKPPEGVYYQLLDIVEFLPGNSFIKFFVEEMEYSQGRWRVRRIREDESEYEFGDKLR